MDISQNFVALSEHMNFTFPGVISGMQTGFGMLESGCVSLKNEVNIMMKNVVDVVLGGITYWAFGYGLSYGDGYSNPIFSTGSWFIDPDHHDPSMEN